MPASEARIRANNKYNAKTYSNISIRIRKDHDIVDLDILRQAADKSGESLNTYILNAIADRMEAEGGRIDDGSENE